VSQLVANDLAELVAAAERRYVDRNPESRRLHEERAAFMPGGNTRSVIHVPPFPLTIVRGEGARLYDADGHAYLDFLGEYTAGLYGHSHPVIVRAIREALDDGTESVRDRSCASGLRAVPVARAHPVLQLGDGGESARALARARRHG
jgi:glutamate-1-semialdehyde 2,1-aminomutase